MAGSVVRHSRYQGKEIQATIQAPTLSALNAMISGMRAYARREKLGEVRVLSKGKDPDGGYKAVISAHNANPFKWIARKWESRGGGWKGRMAKAAVRERHRLAKSKLKEAELARKESLLAHKESLIRAKARVQLAKGEHERAVVAKRVAYMKRPKYYKRRKLTALGW